MCVCKDKHAFTLITLHNTYVSVMSHTQTHTTITVLAEQGSIICGGVIPAGEYQSLCDSVCVCWCVWMGVTLATLRGQGRVLVEVKRGQSLTFQSGVSSCFVSVFGDGFHQLFLVFWT